MAAMITRVTIDDFEWLPDEQVKNHELVDGELVEVPGNSLGHNLIKGLLSVIARPFVRDHRLGTVVSSQAYDFDGNAHAPDIPFFGVAKQALVDLDKRVQRFVQKVRYGRCGTAEVWIVVPAAREVLIYSANGDGILREGAELTSDFISGFRLPVARFFEA